MLRKCMYLLILFSSLAFFGCGISGTVTKCGEGVEGVTVSVSGNLMYKSMKTDENGIFLFQGLIPGNYTVTADPDGLGTMNPESQEVPQQDLVTEAGSQVNFSIEQVWEGDYLISTMEELEAIAGYTKVTGNLTIKEASASLFTNLDALACLTSVEGNLFINTNESLSNIDGVSRLESIGIGLLFYSNPALTNIDGLSSLNSVDDWVIIFSNAALTTLDGLENISAIGGAIVIVGNAALESVDMPSLCEINNGTIAEAGLNISNNLTLCTQNANALIDQVQDSDEGGIFGTITINGNDETCP